MIIWSGGTGNAAEYGRGVVYYIIDAIYIYIYISTKGNRVTSEGVREGWGEAKREKTMQERRPWKRRRVELYYIIYRYILCRSSAVKNIERVRPRAAKLGAQGVLARGAVIDFVTLAESTRPHARRVLPSLYGPGDVCVIWNCIYATPPTPPCRQLILAPGQTLTLYF